MIDTKQLRADLESDPGNPAVSKSEYLHLLAAYDQLALAVNPFRMAARIANLDRWGGHHTEIQNERTGAYSDPHAQFLLLSDVEAL